MIGKYAELYESLARTAVAPVHAAAGV